MNFGKLITVMESAPDQDKNITRTQEASPSRPSSHSSQGLASPSSAGLIPNTVDIVLLIFEFCIIFQYILFCVWLILPNIIFMWFTHVITYISYNIISHHVNIPCLFICSPGGGNLGTFQFGDLQMVLYRFLNIFEHITVGNGVGGP